MRPTQAAAISQFPRKKPSRPVASVARTETASELPVPTSAERTMPILGSLTEKLAADSAVALPSASL